MRPNTQMQIEEMKKQTIGVEVEFTGITRKAAAEVLAKHFGTEAWYDGGPYFKWDVRDPQGRKWEIVRDSSVNNIYGEKCELVTPILKYEDIETLQEVLRKLRRAGAISRPSLRCGIHIHIGADGHTAQTLRNLTNIMASHEKLISKAIRVDLDSRGDYCHVTSPRFLKEVNKKKPKNLDQLAKIWYNGNTSRAMHHYDSSRYHMLNLHSTFQKGTVEFRMFNFAEPHGDRRGGIHAGEIKAYIQLCLAMSQLAKQVRTASPREQQRENERYALRTWLLRLGFIGEEFKTARTILLKNLDGNGSWRHTRPETNENKEEVGA